jgi:hypothetical protein
LGDEGAGFFSGRLSQGVRRLVKNDFLGCDVALRSGRRWPGYFAAFTIFVLREHDRAYAS